MNKLRKLYEQSLLKWGFDWLPATPPGTYLHSFDEFKQKMESDKEMYNKVVKELNQKKMKECKCDKPLLQPLTKQCGKCKMYIDRVRHIILTNQNKEDE